MLRSRVSGWLALLFGLGLVFRAAPALAQAVEAEPPKMKVTWIDADGHEHHETFDLAKPDQLNKVLALVKEHRVTELARMEPVNIMAISWDLGLWTLVVFALLFLILKKAAWGPILDGLQRREESIHGALDEAQKAREEAKLLRDQLQKELDNNAAKVAAMLDEARRDSQKLKDELLSEGRTEVGKERERLLREMTTAKDQAIQDLMNQTAQLATLVSAKVIRRELTAADHRRLVDEALTEFRSSATELRHEAWSKQG